MCDGAGNGRRIIPPREGAERDPFVRDTPIEKLDQIKTESMDETADEREDEIEGVADEEDDEGDEDAEAAHALLGVVGEVMEGDGKRGAAAGWPLPANVVMSNVNAATPVATRRRVSTDLAAGRETTGIGPSIACRDSGELNQRLPRKAESVVRNSRGEPSLFPGPRLPYPAESAQAWMRRRLTSNESWKDESHVNTRPVVRASA